MQGGLQPPSISFFNNSQRKSLCSSYPLVTDQWNYGLDNEFDEGMKTFSHKKFDWEKIKSNCKKFYVFHSNNDPYIPLKDAENLARELGVGLTLIRNGKHLNRD